MPASQVTAATFSFADYVVGWLSGLDASSVTLAVTMICMVLVLYKWQTGPDAFDLRALMVDTVTGKISIEKVAYSVAMVFGTWIMIALTERNRMTENYFGIYLSVFALSRTASSAISVYKDTSMAKINPVDPATAAALEQKDKP